jgi:ubiquinol oxidase
MAHSNPHFMQSLQSQLAYNFSELIEAHAVDTYGEGLNQSEERNTTSTGTDSPYPPPPAGEFADANEELLRSLPPPLCAAEYYSGTDLYLFDAFQTGQREAPRRPPVRACG